MKYQLILQVLYSVHSVFPYWMCCHYEKLVFTCLLLIGSEWIINMTSDWLTDMCSTNVLNSL